MLPGKKISRDGLYALLTGALLAAFAFAFEFKSLPPDLAEDLAAAAGLRPPTGCFALLWQCFAAPLCRHVGLAAAESVLRVAGHVSLGLAAVLCMTVFLPLLPAPFRRGRRLAGWWRGLVRFVVVQGAVLFCCADPVWRAFRWFSPQALQILLALAAA
ncbi:MAG: hypothetical protein IJ829_08295, partial [Kiritimatiellae bacterium]|nr:hypothetical protein [Kiritimatiellia bacterium]